MQFVRTNLVFRLLGDIAVLLRRQQFGTNRRVADILQDSPYRIVVDILGSILDDMTDEGLGDVGIDTVHGHVVAVVSSPSKRQFTQIAGTQNETVILVSHIH